MGDALPHLIVIVGDPAELDAIVAALRAKHPGEVIPARTPMEALRTQGYRDAPLVLYDVSTTAAGARFLHELFPQTILVAIGLPGAEEVLEDEMDAGAADYLIRDPERAYLRLLPRKVHRLLAPSSGAPDRRSIARLEDSLARSEIRFGNLVRAIPDIVYHLDPEGYFIFVNEAVSLLDYRPADIIGRHFSVLVHPDDLSRVSRTHVLRRLQQGERLGPEVRFFDERRSGDRRARGLFVRLLTRPGGTSSAAHRLGDVVSYGMIEATGHYDGGPEMLLSPEGADDNPGFLGTVGIVHDITLNRRSEEMMRIFLQAADQSPVCQLVTNETGVIEYANPPFLRGAGLGPDQVMGRSVANLTESERLGELFGVVADAVRGGNDWQGRLPGRKGALPWTHLTVNAVRDPQSRPTHYIAILTREKG